MKNSQPKLADHTFIELELLIFNFVCLLVIITWRIT